jgi:hypothetical protein
MADELEIMFETTNEVNTRQEENRPGPSKLDLVVWLLRLVGILLVLYIFFGAIGWNTPTDFDDRAWLAAPVVWLTPIMTDIGYTVYSWTENVSPRFGFIFVAFLVITNTITFTITFWVMRATYAIRRENNN